MSLVEVICKPDGIFLPFSKKYIPQNEILTIGTKFHSQFEKRNFHIDEKRLKTNLRKSGMSKGSTYFAYSSKVDDKCSPNLALVQLYLIPKRYVTEELKCLHEAAINQEWAAMGYD